jgi:hypothetical protein
LLLRPGCLASDQVTAEVCFRHIAIVRGLTKGSNALFRCHAFCIGFLAFGDEFFGIVPSGTPGLKIARVDAVGSDDDVS